MRQLWTFSTRDGEAIMGKFFFWIGCFIISRGTFTLVVVDEICAGAWFACSWRTIRDILTALDAIYNCLRETAVADAFKIFSMYSCRVGFIRTNTIRRAFIFWRSAIVHIDARATDTLCAICHAHHLELSVRASENSILAVSRLACKRSCLVENKCRQHAPRTGHPLCMRRNR